MTTWKVVEHSAPDRLTVRYTADDGVRSIVMPDMFWDQVTPLEEWLGRVDPWPQPIVGRLAPMSLVGVSGECKPMERTPPLSKDELDALRPPRDPLTAHLDPTYKPEF